MKNAGRRGSETREKEEEVNSLKAYAVGGDKAEQHPGHYMLTLALHLALAINGRLASSPQEREGDTEKAEQRERGRGVAAACAWRPRTCALQRDGGKSRGLKARKRQADAEIET
ncbi:unnamed protein product [Pleuronectes platessa]|uniref:Uncharacterized protein n=1 Tax=Pleuronectes platessa TaxID=8262 RepID=A0A9N7TIE1_PLEPL|nr:unnamed protein product [Pleuronectes platessa]